MRIFKAMISLIINIVEIVLISIAAVSFAQAGVPENLDEMFNRKQRHSTAVWAAAYLEDPATYIWQPETLMYQDTQTGHEVWKMSNTPGLITYYHNDIGVSPWSADGRKMAFTAWNRFSQAYSQSQQQEWRYIGITINTDGSGMRPAKEASCRLGEAYFHWSPQIPDVYYGVGETHLSSGAQSNILYKNIVDQQGVISKSVLITGLGNASGGKINKMISSDGRKVILELNSVYYPLTIYPENKAGFDDDGFSMDRHFGNYGNSDSDVAVTDYHDQYIAGDGSWYFAMPSNHRATWWRIKTRGSSSDGGALYTGDIIAPVNEPPYDFGECWPENHGGVFWTIALTNINGSFRNSEIFSFMPLGVSLSGTWDQNKPSEIQVYVRDYYFNNGLLPKEGDTVTGLSSGATAILDYFIHVGRPSPFVQGNPYNPDKTSYWSHFVPDRWARHALFSNVCDNLPKGYGPGVWDIAKHSWVVSSFGGGAQHHDWHGFTDWVVSSGGSGASFIYTQKYNDESSQVLINSAYNRFDSGDQYYSLVRPGQSPDGTKVSWHSEFLNGKNATDIFWSVVYYPYPPEDLTSGYDNGVKIGFLPPKYTERKWPYISASANELRNGAWPQTDENGLETGEVLYAREIKKYHVWRAISPSGPWQEIGQINALYSHIYHPAEDSANDMMMLHPVDSNGLKISETNKITYTDNPADGVWYYAFTSEEHSGLESHELSEILEVVVLEGSIVSSQVVQPKGQKDFWKTLPQPPKNFTYQPTGVAGHYQLNWDEPEDSKTRYYNIYYSTGGIPEADQQHRIASVPVGTSIYLDWCADLSLSAYYRITSVDRQGNEGVDDKVNGVPEDINADDKVDVFDVQICVNVLLGSETEGNRISKAKAIAEPADKCDVLDVQAVVNVVLAE